MLVRKVSHSQAAHSNLFSPIELLANDEGRKEMFTYWLTEENDIERAKALVPASDSGNPYTILNRVCLVSSRQIPEPYNDATLLHQELMENGMRLVEIEELLSIGLSEEEIVQSISNEIISSFQ